jgi:uncharacterized protein (DUF3084 family)
MRATTASTQGAGSASSTDSKSEVSKLTADKQQLQKELDQAKAEAAGAVKNLAAVKAQAQVGLSYLRTGVAANLRHGGLAAVCDVSTATFSTIRTCMIF